jgi:hypothetical protein
MSAATAQQQLEKGSRHHSSQVLDATDVHCTLLETQLEARRMET